MLLNAQGKPYFTTGCPDYCEKERQESYLVYRRMYKGKKLNETLPDYEGRIFGNKAFKRIFNLIINFPGLLSRACGDLLFGEPARFKAKNGKGDEYLQKLKRDSFLDSQLFTSEISNSYRGDAVLALIVTNGTARIKTIPAYNYYILPSADDCTIAEAEYIASKTVSVDGKNVIRITEYTDGMIRELAYEALKVDGSEHGKECWKVGNEVSLEYVYGVNNSSLPAAMLEYDKAYGRMIQHIPNFHDDEQFFGFSDYCDLVSIFDAINNRISNIDGYLDVHSKPKLVGPDELLDLEGNFDFQADFLAMQNAEANKSLYYLTWDGKIEGSMRQLEYLEKKMFQISEMSQAIFGIDLISSVDSSMAMRQFFVRTKAKINRKRMLYDERLKRFLFAVMYFCARLKLDGAQECEGIDIFWQDGIPRDYAESVQIESQRIGAGMTSVRSAMKRTDLISDEEVDEEFGQIKKEKEDGILPDTAVESASNGGGVNNTPTIKNAIKKADFVPGKTGLRTKG